jgi:hypothetical protein
MTSAVGQLSQIDTSGAHAFIRILVLHILRSGYRRGSVFVKGSIILMLIIGRVTCP